MNKGRAKCDRLKKIRKAVADRLNVDLHQSECTFEGNCRGTCPKCKQEEEILNRELLKRAAGAGIGVLAGLSLAGCAPLAIGSEGAPLDREEYADDVTDDSPLTGEAPWPEDDWSEGAPLEADDDWIDDEEAPENEECNDDIEGLVPAESSEYDDMNEGEELPESEESGAVIQEKH